MIRLALTDLFAAKWTVRIHEEWIRNVLENRPDIPQEQLQRTRALMDDAVPDCLVTGYEALIEGLNLPDDNDRHVLATAIRAGAQIIVTFNLKDFPADALEPYGIEVMHPDVFAEYQMELHDGAVVFAAKQQRAALINPPKRPEYYLETLASQGLVVTADRLREFIDLI